MNDISELERIRHRTMYGYEIDETPSVVNISSRVGGLSIPDLYTEVETYGNMSADYVDKMIHKIPDAPVFDRADYLIKAARGKIILDIGASGPMSEMLKGVAKEYYGVDIIEDRSRYGFYQIDLETVDRLPDISPLDLIIAGEILEHLSNAGHLLDMLHRAGVQVIVTVPNAFSLAARQQIDRGIESVNKEHVAWYSYHTLKVLTERHGFNTLLWGWYNGKPYTAEGLIFHMEPING